MRRTCQPKNKQYKRKHGSRGRTKTRSGCAILRVRHGKGRKRLSV